MKSEKVKEIKEFLEVLSPYGNIVKYADILTYINELESENELLRNELVAYENIDYYFEDSMKAEKRIAALEKENAKLKKKQFLKVANFAKLLYTKYKITGESSQVYILYTEEELNEELKRCNHDS